MNADLNTAEGDAGDSNPLPQLLTVQQVAKILVVSATAVYELCNAGLLGYRRIGVRGGRIRIEKRDVDKYLRQNKVEGVASLHAAADNTKNSLSKARVGVSTGATLLRAAGWKG